MSIDRLSGEVAALAARVDRVGRAQLYAAIADVVASHRAEAPDDAESESLRRTSLTGWERGVFSQFGEDGVIAELVRRVGAPTRYFVEFGAETGLEGNCLLLASALGWSGLLIEGDAEKARTLVWRLSPIPGVQAIEGTVTPENVEEHFRTAGVPDEPDVLSIDVDGIDWWIWRAIRSFRPRIVVVEYNGHLTLDRALTVPAQHRDAWDGTAYYGASLTAYERLARAKGYRLVHTELNGNNAFYVREDLCRTVPDDDVVPRRMTNLFLAGGVHAPDPHGRPWVEIGEDGEPSTRWQP
jgi:hypothetical protein